MNVLEALGLFSAIAGSMALIDLFQSEKRKAIIAEYIFGFRNVSFASFETNLIQHLMSLFMDGEKLPIFRVYLRFTLLAGLSVATTVTIIANMTYGGVLTNEGLSLRAFQSFLLIALIYVVFSPFALVCDYASLTVTRFLFVRQSPNFPLSALSMFLDLMLSFLIPFFAMVFCLRNMTTLEISEMTGNDYLYFMAVLVIIYIACTSLVVSFVQLVSLTIGTAMRVVMIVTRMNTVIAMNSEVYRHPFAFIGILTGVTCVSLILVF